MILKFNGKRVTLKLNTRDFYVMGFVANDGILWEFRLETDVPRLRESRAVGMRLNYPPLVGLPVSKEALKNAFSNLDRMLQGRDIAYSAALICLVFCAGGRFSLISHTFRRHVSSSKPTTVELTRLAMECDEEDIVLTVEKGVVDRDYSYF
ncbi:hypothetical protein Tco_1096439, partial [Tanacetum coccineum]